MTYLPPDIIDNAAASLADALTPAACARGIRMRRFESDDRGGMLGSEILDSQAAHAR